MLQTCVSPDYILVDQSIKVEFLKALKQAVVDFFGENPQASSDLSRIINAAHTRRLAALLQDDECVITVVF